MTDAQRPMSRMPQRRPFGGTHLHCHTDCKSSVSLERLVNALKNVHPALKACYLVTHERYVLIVPV